MAAGCPGYASTTTSPLPPSSGCGPYASWTATQTDEVWTGGCSQGGYTVAGTLGAGYLDTLCKLTSNTTDGLLGAGFDLQWTGAGSAPGLQGLSVDGSLDWRSSYNQNMPPTVETIEIDASVGVVGALSGAVAAAAFPPGQTTVDLFISFADSGAFANAEMIAGDMTVSATARELSAPWVLAGSASWAGPDFMGFGGCMDEPESGVLTVEVWDAPGGSLLGTATLAFDGATACDGCADVSLDGVSVGTWCDSAWELRNPLGPSPM